MNNTMHVEPTTNWAAPRPGHWRRDFRLAEWLPAPVTPSCETWLLPALERGFADVVRDRYGAELVLPMHVIVNGWYFTNDGKFDKLLGAVLRRPRAMFAEGLAMATFATHPERGERSMVAPGLDAYRTRLLPDHCAAIDAAHATIGTASPDELVAVIDRLARSTGTLLYPMVTAAGFAGKAEFALVRFFNKHVRPRSGGSHLDLLVGLVEPCAPADHDVTSIDWVEPTAVERRVAEAHVDEINVHTELAARRGAAEAAARSALAPTPKLRRRFDELLDIAQRSVFIREELVGTFTTAWPLLRAALARVGDGLVSRGVVAHVEDVYFLRRDEITAAIDVEPTDRSAVVAARRRVRQEQKMLNAPLSLGKPAGPWKRVDRILTVFAGDEPAGDAVVSGIGTSAGTATGPVRIVRGVDDFDKLEPGDILVAPITAPAWTPLFSLAAAVVTDGGSPFAHASVIAREYAIPAVVGTGDATGVLRDGWVVTVDGAAGTVVRAGADSA